MTCLTSGFAAPDPAALERLRAVHGALPAQKQDRHRVAALLALVGVLVEDYGDG